MKLLLPYFIILIVIIQLKLHKSTKNNKQRTSDFWERETKANSTRKKDISNLNYITIPDTLPLINTQDEEILRAYDTINKLRCCKILNLSGMSNTDIKLTYGVPNLPVLSEYDDNFISLIRTLDKIGRYFLSDGHNSEGCEILKYAVSIGSDIKSTYTALSDYYITTGNKDALDKLILYADTIQSAAGKRIKEYLMSISI